MKKILSLIVAVIMIVSSVPFGMTASAFGNSDYDRILINQVYGAGEKSEAYWDYDFIELYNPNSYTVDLGGDGYVLKYHSYSTKSVGWKSEKTLDLTGSIPAYSSYLIRCGSNNDALLGTAQVAGSYKLGAFDQDWDGRNIDNKTYQVVLEDDDEEDVDSLTVNSDEALLTLSTVGMYPVYGSIFDGTSKKKSARREEFKDTEDNSKDFETIDYSEITETKFSRNRPRSTADGPWTIVTGGSLTLTSDTTARITFNSTSPSAVKAQVVPFTAITTDSFPADSDKCLTYTGSAAKAANNTYDITIEITGLSNKMAYLYRYGDGTIWSGKEQFTTNTTKSGNNLIINQIYGGGQTSAGMAPVSNSFVEIVNTTNNDISVNGYMLIFNDESLCTLIGKVPAGGSYLIQCAAETNNATVLKYTVSTYDKQWDYVIDNKEYKAKLYTPYGELLDSVTVKDEDASKHCDEGMSIIGVSKNVSIRRKNYTDTNDNSADFELITYLDITPADILAYRPRTTKDKPVIQFATEMLGDCYKDEKITVADSMYLARFVAGWDGYSVSIAAGDLNSDGNVNAADLIILMRHLANWSGYQTIPIAVA